MELNFDEEMERYAKLLDDMQQLINVKSDLSEKDQSFASSLINQFVNTKGLSARQWEWVGKLAERGTAIEPLYGNFEPLLVAFRLAGEHLKYPKIRLVSEQERFVQLNFFPDSQVIKVFVDGWQGHGFRKFAGLIEDGMIKPWSRDRLTDDVRMVIESLANDPIGVSKAMAAKLGACIYCGNRLSDPISKRMGYGKTCASHYGLPYGANAEFQAA